MKNHTANNLPVFPGITAPSTDFDPVRDQRRATLLYYDVNLTNARSIAANTPLILNIAGNSFYVDQDTGTVGYATVHFQDTTLGIAPAPIYVGPGFIANVPFTQLLIENTAQAGKRLRIFYGVDIDFQAGVNAQVSITGTIATTVGIASLLGHGEYTNSYVSNTTKAANTPDTIFTPAANVNGAIVWHCDFATETAAAAFANSAVLAKNAAPANVTDGVAIVTGVNPTTRNANYGCSGELKNPIKIPAGLGLYFIATNAESNAMRSCTYTLL